MFKQRDIFIALVTPNVSLTTYFYAIQASATLVSHQTLFGELLGQTINLFIFGADMQQLCLLRPAPTWNFGQSFGRSAT
jgi:hypothetical protein